SRPISIRREISGHVKMRKVGHRRRLHLGLAIGWTREGRGAQVLPVSRAAVEAARTLFHGDFFGMGFFGDIRMRQMHPVLMLEADDALGRYVFGRVGCPFEIVEQSSDMHVKTVLDRASKEDPDLPEAWM
ncbi:hypothetical protein ACEUZ9_004029, partial [Paracoccus litorisediminis]|uniref:hypothetical protein n=1 Tax=Paracoccus litorisediminis TaxID=2006130 RepID=UPI00372FA48D